VSPSAREAPVDPKFVWIAITVAIVAAFGYVLVMRVFFKDSKDLDKKIDLSKMKPWKDDD
jgi:low affinity Fe/Cu permease